VTPGRDRVLAVRVDERAIRPVGGDGGAAPRRDVPPATDAVVTVVTGGDTVTVTVAGEIDMANAAAVEQQILRAVASELRAVTVDLTGLRYIDSAGLWVLFRLGVHLSAAGISGELVVAAEGPVRRMVETAGVAAAIPVRLGGG
jgi:anti-anti-sigma factor